MNVQSTSQSNDTYGISILEKENGYSEFSTKIITTQEELAGFIDEVENQPYWNNKAVFLNVMSTLNINFQVSNLLLIRHTEGSGSTRVEANLKVEGNNVSVLVNCQRPDIGTCDMAYYCFGYVVPKNAGNSVECNNSSNREEFVYTLK
mmetsp:Transcript_22608/g.27727  ORF Transcript_22608/g.27727 Transcript_22608/m.27727 type:complete len:148 (-) Transcript_22608:207-650(-)